MKLRNTSPRPFVALIAALFALCAAATNASAQATTTTTNETIPFTNTLPNPCNGDLITFQGNLHFTNTVTTDAAGGFHLKTHVNYQNASGTGTPSGVTYRVGTVSNETLNDSDTSQTETTVIQTVKLVAQGPALDYFTQFVFHVTVNANGQTTSEVTESRITCRAKN